ncbi:hypothetical protein NPIL_248291 [Nephila pilipes]|uniref:Uncharacterized protein n=1 Tax=Nephila pilipes TaxID=299642 RepID=A0A8X6NLY9_NEPPI|nr:hypothetical protein NPIL_248291 [Nephila pilipes]
MHIWRVNTASIRPSNIIRSGQFGDHGALFWRHRQLPCKAFRGQSCTPLFTPGLRQHQRSSTSGRFSGLLFSVTEDGRVRPYSNIRTRDMKPSQPMRWIYQHIVKWIFLSGLYAGPVKVLSSLKWKSEKLFYIDKVTMDSNSGDYSWVKTKFL